MSPTVVVIILIGYFLALIAISYFTSWGADSQTFFTAHRQSPWYLVAFGMVGSSLSGVTFVSVPGNVGRFAFAYFQVVLGYWVGYWIIIGLLMPLYYRLRVISIYTYLQQRFGFWAYKSGAAIFLVARSMGASLRLFLTATVLQLFLFDEWGVPFWFTVGITIVLIWIYTFRGGVKTIIWTDTFQTFFLIAAVVFTVWQVSDQLQLSLNDLAAFVKTSPLTNIFVWEVNSSLFFPKQFIGGMFITLGMTGLDQEIMQKNLTCKSLGEAQKNMFWYSFVLVVINFLFLMLGALLYYYCQQRGITPPARADELYPQLALHELGTWVGLLFLLGITASSYASADAALAGLTTSFCIDFLNFESKPEATRQRQKFIVHLSFSLLFLIIILVFKELNNRSVIDSVLNVAGYTYGPLIGMFAFGMFTQKQPSGVWIPVICIASPLLSYLISTQSAQWLGHYQIGIEILLINGILTFLGLGLASWKRK